jgi:FdhE protein
MRREPWTTGDAMTDRRHTARPPAGTFLPPDASAAIHEQGQATPEWKPWLGLLEAALRHADDAAWRGAEMHLAGARPVDAPLLEGARIRVDGQAATRLVAELLRLAGLGQDGDSVPDLNPLRLLDAGLRQDEALLARITAASEPGVEEAQPVPSAVAHFSVLPLLLEAARRATDAIPPAWARGYCPVCAGWPTLVELRGLERRRVLRCGRCATGWTRDVLHCAFCGERDHRRQGSLIPDQEAELVRVEVCDSCHGYLKCVTTLRAKAPWALALDDLRTLPLDLTALERGYRRPEQPGWSLSLALVERSDVAAGGAP